MPSSSGAQLVTQDQAFWRNWNLYCCDQDHGQPSTSILTPSNSDLVASSPCVDQSCNIQSYCCNETACPVVELPPHVQAVEECCFDAHAECFDQDCLAGVELPNLQATTCEDPACGVEGFACSDDECKFLQEYLSCCGVPPGRFNNLNTSTSHNLHPRSEAIPANLLSPSSFDALLQVALPLVHDLSLPPQLPLRQHTLPSQRGSASSASSAIADPSPAQQAPAKVHICHWQNCHEQFGSVQSLLTHISVKHLETDPPVDLLKGLEGNQVQTGSKPGQPMGEVHTSNGLLMGLGSSNAMDIDQGGRSHDLKTQDGLLACLWDDCLPPVDGFSGFGEPGTSNAHHQQHFDFNPTQLSHPKQTANGNTLFGSVSQVTASVEPHSATSLDSATAVLKHLLQQHLGMDVTKGLLDAAAAHASVLTTASENPSLEMLVAPPNQDAEKEERRGHRHHGHRSHGSVRMPVPIQLRHPRVLPLSQISSSTERPNNATHPHACHWIDCEERFSSLAALTDHLSDRHVGKGKTEYECLWSGCVNCDCDENSGDGDGCEGCEHMHAVQEKGQQTSGRKFASRQKIMRHMQSHTGYRPFICSICKQGFSEQATLQVHFQRHAREKPFECDHPGCEKAFSVAASLSTHKRTHGGGKIYECPICQRGFVESSNLTKHIRTHTGERPHICAFPGCTKRFSRPDQLKRHARTHSKDKTQKQNKSKRYAASPTSRDSMSPNSTTARHGQ